MSVGKKIFIILVMMTFPLTIGYVALNDSQQAHDLCDESQERYDVIHGILTLVAKNSEDPKTVEPYFKILGNPPKC